MLDVPSMEGLAAIRSAEQTFELHPQFLAGSADVGKQTVEMLVANCGNRALALCQKATGGRCLLSQRLNLVADARYENHHLF